MGPAAWSGASMGSLKTFEKSWFFFFKKENFRQKKNSNVNDRVQDGDETFLGLEEFVDALEAFVDFFARIGSIGAVAASAAQQTVAVVSFALKRAVD